MTQHKRRVSYVIPPPTDPVPRLQLPPYGVPRLGVVGPLLMQVVQSDSPEGSSSSISRHPRHRLGVASLALDASTQLAGRSSPEGILYSGGKDGLIISWDLGVPTKKRRFGGGALASGKWEVVTGWADDVIDEENEDEDRVASDGDILGDVNHRRQQLPKRSGDIPYENQWETDATKFKPGVRSRFRQCAEAHRDWVNDIALCNYNQTVVSASSDGTIKAWNPHSTTNSDPMQIGSHSDYVRCLTYCREQNWVASGSFDRTVKLWDLNSSSPKQALVTLNPPDATAPKSSVYALSCDPFGRTIASGSPERVIRLWDPRSGKRTGKLVGHTDNIRAILISEDAKYLLTGSADASIKLWSLSSQRCLHTFTHHTDSVWSLSSSHPSLEVFYSGDRSGLVCRVDVEDCSDVSEGECILLCRDSIDSTQSTSEGINKIVTMDDNLLWVASGNSSVKRWHIPQRRASRPPPSILTEFDGDRVPYVESPSTKKRFNSSGYNPDAPIQPGSISPKASFSPSITSISSDHIAPQHVFGQGDKLYGIPMVSLVKLTSPNDPFTFHSSPSRDPEVATLYSAASVMSVPRASTYITRSPTQTLFQRPHQPNPPPLHGSRTEDTFTYPVASSAQADYEERELAADAVPLVFEADDVIKGDDGLVRSIILNDRIHALTVDTSGEVAVWDIVRGICRGKFAKEDVYAASHTGSTVGGSTGEKERSPRQALEIVRERIEGEAVIASWCSTDTKAGVLAVHITEKCFEAEVYADEVGFAHDRHFNDESKLNIGKWVLRNLFIGFIREEQRARRASSSDIQDGLLAPSIGRTPVHRASSESQTMNGSGRRKSLSPESSRKVHRTSGSQVVINSHKMIPAIAPLISSSARSSPLLTSLIPLNAKDGNPPLPIIPQTPGAGGDGTAPLQSFPMSTDGGTTPLPLASSTNQGDYVSARIRQISLQGQGTAGPAEEVAGAAKPDAQAPSVPSGLMGRLRNFGRAATKRPVSDGAPSSPILGTIAPAVEATVNETSADRTVEISKTAVQMLLAGPLSPPTTSEAPLHYMPPHTTLIISEEASPSYSVIYRGSTGMTHVDLQALEEAMPMWSLEYLLINKLPPIAPSQKLSFVLIPWNRNPDAEVLPELLNTQQSKLTASRQLRVRKIVVHVQDKMDKITGGSRTGSTRSSVEEFSRTDGHSRSNSVKMRAEDEYEILCNETLLPLTMTLVAVRQYVWKQGSELVMHYRRKAGAGIVGRQLA